VIEIVYLSIAVIIFFILLLLRRNLFSLGMIFFLLFSIYYFFPAMNKTALYSHILFEINYYESAIYYCMTFLISWFLGYIFGFYKQSKIRIEIKITKLKAINNLGILSLLLTVLGYFLVGGYSNIGNYGNISYSDSYFSTLIQFHLIAALFLALAFISDKNHIILFVTTGIVCISIFAIGVRSTAVSLSLPIAYKLFFDSGLIKQAISIIFGFFVLMIVQTIRQFNNWFQTIEQLKSFFNEGLPNILFLQSQTFAILTKIIPYYQEKGPLYGASLLEGIRLLIPGPVRRAFGFNDCVFFCPSSWFMEYSASDWEIGGWAFSIVAEMVMNFGFLLSIPIFIIGYMMSRIDNSFCKMKNTNDLHILIAFILIGACFPFFRNDFALTFKIVIYQLIILKLIIFFTTKIFRKKNDE
jgi:oligosaccharide repeat unit polymerase